MTHDSNRQPERVREHQERLFPISRRDLLKHVAVAGSISATGKVASATETSEYPADGPDNAEIQFEKILTVEGVGTGVNEYHIETRGNIRLDEISIRQDGTFGEREFDGSIRKGDSDSYFFTGRVTNVYARGSILYSVSNHD